MTLSPAARFWLAVWLVALAAFIALAARASTDHVWSLDLSLARRIQDGPGILGPPSDLANWLGSTLPLALITAAAALGLLARRLTLEAVLVLATFLPRAADLAVKHLVGEARPTADLVRVSIMPDSPGFPSGHVVGVVVVFAVLYVLAPRLLRSPAPVVVLKAAAVVFVAIIGIARVWAGAHWPSDVLGGYLFALLYLAPSTALYQRWQRRNPGA